MPDNAAISIHNVSVKYKLIHERSLTLKETAINFLKGKRDKYEYLWALKGINMSVKKGETIGIIGSNGSGKSTLLKVIAKIVDPSDGTIRHNGMLSAMIELGAGFNPELTGEENIYLNGAILGLSKSTIRRKFGEIVEFAELEKFIDIPVKNYSSGMYMRLGFALSTAVDPDILIIDEILAVGDESFQKKCFKKLNEFKQKGRTIIIVSHDLNSIERMCDKAYLIRDGNLVSEGYPQDVIHFYRSLISKGEIDISNVPSRQGSGDVTIKDVKFYSSSGIETDSFNTGDMLRVRIEYYASKKIDKPVFGVAIHSENWVHINGPNTKLYGLDIDFIQGAGALEYTIHSLTLLEGGYYFTVAIFDYTCTQPYDYWDKCLKFNVSNGNIKERYGIFYMPSEWKKI
ncbi:MAG: ABC transporter ATP-binding protein [Nitrospinae bacterium]|nr:ABC transporter ATP-binding protein [Nitrospinota bacterium]